MPDYTAWRLYHSKALRAFSNWRAKSCSIWSRGTCCDLNWDFVQLVDNLTWTSFRGIPVTKWDFSNSAIYEKDQRGPVVLQSHPWWASSSPEVSTEEGSVWTRGDGVPGSSLRPHCSGLEDEEAITSLKTQWCVWSNPCSFIHTNIHTSPLCIFISVTRVILSEKKCC